MRWLEPIAAASSRRLRSAIPALSAWLTAAASSRSLACEVAMPQCTIWYMSHLVQRKHGEQLGVEAEGTARASAATIWHLVSDATTYPQWGPWSDGGFNKPGDLARDGAGAVRWFRYGRTKTVEQVLAAEADKRLSYTVVGGIPVRNYLAEVTLSPVAG